MRSGQKQDVLFLSDLNHRSPHSNLFHSPWLCPHLKYLKMLFLLLFPEASPFYLHILELYKSINERSPLSPGGAALCLLWYFAVFSVASCFCVNKFVLKYSKNQSSTCPFSASPILTCWEGFGCRHGYVLTPRMHALLDSHPLLIWIIFSVHSLSNLRRLGWKKK